MRSYLTTVVCLFVVALSAFLVNSIHTSYVYLPKYFITIYVGTCVVRKVLVNDRKLFSSF
jgi:hypothetical protein